MSKLEQTFEQITNAIYDIESYQELDETGRAYLLDDLIDVMEDLHKKEVIEGYYYEELIQIVKDGEEIPQPFSTIKAVGVMSDETYDIKVKVITEIKRNSNGDLIVRYLGRRSK